MAKPLDLLSVVEAISEECEDCDDGDRLTTTIEEENSCILGITYYVSYTLEFYQGGDVGEILSHMANKRIDITEMSLMVYDVAEEDYVPASPDYIPFNANQIENEFYSYNNRSF